MPAWYQGFCSVQEVREKMESYPQEKTEEQSCKSHEDQDLWDLQAAPKWNWQKRIERGATVWWGLRKVHVYNKMVGWSHVKRVHHSLEGCGWGYLHLQETQRSARHFWFLIPCTLKTWGVSPGKEQ